VVFLSVFIPVIIVFWVMIQLSENTNKNALKDMEKHTVNLQGSVFLLKNRILFLTLLSRATPQ
jgi:hypothetical protein